MNLKKYNTTETTYNKRELTESEYLGFTTINADDMVYIEDIIIPPEFANSHTNPNKIKKAIRFYVKNGHFDKPISVIPEINEKGRKNKLLLINELSRYLAAIKLNLDIVPVKYIDFDC